MKDCITKHLEYCDSEDDGRNKYNMTAIRGFGLENKTINDSERLLGRYLGSPPPRGCKIDRAVH